MKDWLAGSYPVAVGNSKQEMRRPVITAMEEQKKNINQWVAGWFGQETQSALAQFKANLAKKSKL